MTHVHPSTQEHVPGSPQESPSIDATDDLVARFQQASRLRTFATMAPRLSPEDSLLSPANTAARIFPTPLPASPGEEEEEIVPPLHQKKKRAILVESVSNWRAQDRAERDAGYEEYDDDRKVLVPFYECDRCGISIGPDYGEQELWLYEAYQVSLTFIEEPVWTRFPELAWIQVCGGCARNFLLKVKNQVKKIMLPEENLMIRPEYWLTTVLFNEHDAQGRALIEPVDLEDEASCKKIRARMDEHILSFVMARLLLMVTHFALMFHISLKSLLCTQAEYEQAQEEERHRPIPITARKRNRQKKSSLSVQQQQQPQQKQEEMQHNPLPSRSPQHAFAPATLRLVPTMS